MISAKNHEKIQKILTEALSRAQNDSSGHPATYIPELAQVPLEKTLASIMLTDGTLLSAGEDLSFKFTLQSVAKLILLAGLLEDFGEKRVFSWVGTEPSGHDFSNISRLEYAGPLPSNPCVNAGAITLCDHIPGKTVPEKLQWLDHWMCILFEEPIFINQAVFASESTTGYRNLALAGLLKSNGTLKGDIEDILHIYFSLCSYEANILQTSRFSAMLARGGITLAGKRVLSKKTVRSVVSIMTTCGLYDESGRHLIRTGLPAKSGVSGLIIALAPTLGGISVFSPRINSQGGSIRGHLMLEYLSAKLGWHFATVP
jgi:glutaminase